MMERDRKPIKQSVNTTVTNNEQNTVNETNSKAILKPMFPAPPK